MYSFRTIIIAYEGVGFHDSGAEVISYHRWFDRMPRRNYCQVQVIPPCLSRFRSNLHFLKAHAFIFYSLFLSFFYFEYNTILNLSPRFNYTRREPEFRNIWYSKSLFTRCIVFGNRDLDSKFIQGIDELWTGRHVGRQERFAKRESARIDSPGPVQFFARERS